MYHARNRINLDINLRCIFHPKSRAPTSHKVRGSSHHWLPLLEEVWHEHPGLCGRPLGPEELGSEVPEHRHPHDASDALAQAAAALPRRGAATLRLRRPLRSSRWLRHRRRRAGSEWGGRERRTGDLCEMLWAFFSLLIYKVFYRKSLNLLQN
jgi:hypothetical protein